MAEIKVTTEVTGKAGVFARLQAIRARATDLRPFWRDVLAPKYFGTVQDLFALEGQHRDARGRFGAGAWAPLSKQYAAWKAKHYPGKLILQREGHLVESLRWDGNALGAGGVFDPTPSSVTVGTRIRYAAANQKTRRFLDPPDPAVFNPLLKIWLARSA